MLTDSQAMDQAHRPMRGVDTMAAQGVKWVPLQIGLASMRQQVESMQQELKRVQILAAALGLMVLVLLGVITACF